MVILKNFLNKKLKMIGWKNSVLLEHIKLSLRVFMKGFCMSKMMSVVLVVLLAFFVSGSIKAEPACPGGVCPNVVQQDQGNCPGGVCPNSIQQTNRETCPGGVCPNSVRQANRETCPGGVCPNSVRQGNCPGGVCPLSRNQASASRQYYYRYGNTYYGTGYGGAWYNYYSPRGYRSYWGY